MAEPRIGERLCDTIARLPSNSGIVLGDLDRKTRFRATQLARRRRLLLIEARSPLIARVHNASELRRAGGARLVFISPVYSTRSHPGMATLGLSGFAALARKAKLPVIALGGMDARRFRRLRRFGAYGWAAIDALTPNDQKRKAVPT